MSKEEKNRMIAEFVAGGKAEDGYSKKSWSVHLPSEITGISESIFTFTEHLKFHTSWDWLMPVVEKIETIQLPNPSMVPVRVEIKGNSCRIFKGLWNEGKEGFISYVSYSGNNVQYTKQEATYNSIVDFIEWYNENNKEK